MAKKDKQTPTLPRAQAGETPRPAAAKEVLSKRQLSILLRKVVCDGEFWPRDVEDTNAAQALVDKGLLERRVWVNEKTERRVVCLALTVQGLRMLIAIVEEKETKVDKSGDGEL